MSAPESVKGGTKTTARIGKFLREVRSELRKVAWPNRSELTSYTAVVLVAVAAVAAFVGIIDYIVSVVLGLVI